MNTEITCEKGEGKGRKGSGKYGAPSTGKSWNVGSGVKNVKHVIRSNLLNLDCSSHRNRSGRRATFRLQCSRYLPLKKQQTETILTLAQGLDVFACLPTGFGKPLCYALLPLVFDYLLPPSSSHALVPPPGVILHRFSATNLICGFAPT